MKALTTTLKGVIETVQAPTRFQKLKEAFRQIDAKLEALLQKKQQVTTSISELKATQASKYQEWASLKNGEGSRLRADLDSLAFEIAARTHEAEGLDLAVDTLRNEKGALSPEYEAFQQAEAEQHELAHINSLHARYACLQREAEVLDDQLGKALRAADLAKSAWQSAIMVRNNRLADAAWTRRKEEINAKRTGVTIVPSAPAAGE
jgi:chromosome segregation ATPase